MENLTTLKNVVKNFRIHGEIVKIEKVNKGYINSTYRVETLSVSNHIHQYLLQRINTKVFPDVDTLMSNYQFTVEHLCENLQMPGRHRCGTAQLLRNTKDGNLYYEDESGAWRLMTYFDNVYSLDIPDTPDDFYYAGVSFGQFIKAMSSVDPSRIKVVIPNFHNTRSRYEDLEATIVRASEEKAEEIADEIAFIRARTDMFGKITDALENGVIPTRVCHNDSNLNNILFDKETHLPVAIIDLDTVMPSSPLYDFGDSMRIGTNTARDDEKDLSKVACDLVLFERYARGYLESCGDILTKAELELLPYAALIITAEDGIRFLMDHLNGDTYYKTNYRGQNLDRARTQLKLLLDMENKLVEMRRILQKIYDDQGLDACVV